MTENAKLTLEWQYNVLLDRIVEPDGYVVAVPVNKFSWGHEAFRLIAPACNSYAKHCSDPLAAAEADLLGKALAAIRFALDFSNGLMVGFSAAAEDEPGWAIVRDQIDKNVSAPLAAVLAKAEGKP